MEMLGESKRFLAYFGLGSNAFVRMDGKLIRRVSIRCAILFVLLLCVAFQCYLCMQNNMFNVTTIILPFVSGLTCLSIILSYASLIWKTEQIEELLDYVQHVVDSRTELLAIISDYCHVFIPLNID